jgi:GntR family transcriptional regulator, rspAB operon transcriptional repressor
MASAVAEAEIREQIAAAIAEGEFPPGTQLVEAMLAARFGVSRSPVRGALRALEGDGLVVRYPHRGNFVAALLPEDIEEIFYLREALELAAVRLAYDRIPEEELAAVEEVLDSLSPQGSPREEFVSSDNILHDMIARNSGNSRLRDALKQLSAQIEITRRTSISQKGRLAANLAEHREIITALRLRDLPLIEARLRVHLKAGKASTLEACQTMMFKKDGKRRGTKGLRKGNSNGQGEQ